MSKYDYSAYRKPLRFWMAGRPRNVSRGIQPRRLPFCRWIRFG